MASIFSKIINGDIPCHKIAESEQYLAFLDITPIAKGHTLVVPKQEVDYIFDLEDDVLSGMMLFAKEVAKGLEKAIECKRVGVAIVGLEVPHAHIHLIPINEVKDISFTTVRDKNLQEGLAEVAVGIRKYLKD